MTLRLLTEHHLEFLILKGGCTGSFESIYVKMMYGWKSHVVAHVHGLSSFKHPKLQIIRKTPVTLLKIVYICMTAISPNASS